MAETGPRNPARGFDRFGFGDFLRRRDGRPVEAYEWSDGTVSWITTDEGRRHLTGICLVRSFLSHHSRTPLPAQGGDAT